MIHGYDIVRYAIIRCYFRHAAIFYCKSIFRKRGIILKIVIMDGQGGALGKSVVEAIKRKNIKAEIIVIGTNSIATSAMLGAGADCGATGENSVAVVAREADIIVGPIGIMAANSMLGEITPKMARAIGESRAKKILIPVSRCNVLVVGTRDLPYAERIRLAVELVAAETDDAPLPSGLD